jgi:hypothetical protein
LENENGYAAYPGRPFVNCLSMKGPPYIYHRAESTTSSSIRTRANTEIVSPTNDNNAAALEWDKAAERATASIILYLGERTEHSVIDIRNPVERWRKLPTIFERNGFSLRFYLWKKLFTLQLADYQKNVMKEMQWKSTVMHSACISSSFTALALLFAMKSKHQYCSTVQIVATKALLSQLLNHSTRMLKLIPKSMWNN